MEDNKIIDKIKKLTKLSENNPSQHEAIAAALKAQKLMAQYNINRNQIEECLDNDKIIEKVYTQAGNSGMRKWKFSLAEIISKNYRVKFFIRNRTKIVFFGYENDVEIAYTVFKFLFETGNKLAYQFYIYLRNQGFSTKGRMNDFLGGYMVGLSQVLDKQCKALMITTPQEVEDAYDERRKNFSGSINCGIHILKDDIEAFEKGIEAGRDIAESRTLTASPI